MLNSTFWIILEFLSLGDEKMVVLDQFSFSEDNLPCASIIKVVRTRRQITSNVRFLLAMDLRPILRVS